MSDESDRLQVMECPSCGASLAVPNADTFVCDYCGKHILIPAAYRSGRAAPGEDAPQDASGSDEWPQVQPTEIDSGLLQQRRVRFIIILATVIAIFLIGLVLFIVLLQTPISSSGGSAQSSPIELNITLLPAMVLFARLQPTFGSVIGGGKLLKFAVNYP
jgi:predicted RNA-binding Zn-ribbon protein involved in translation (DUF1610 family)